MKNMWHSIQAQSIYRITKPSKPIEQVKAFQPKAVLWTKQEDKFNSLELQTKLNNELINFLKRG